MINKCKVQIIGRDLYNVEESLKEGRLAVRICTHEIKSLLISISVSLLL